MIRTLHEGLLADGIAVPLTKLCAWFGVPRRTVYYKPTKAAPKADDRFAVPIKAMIEDGGGSEKAPVGRFPDDTLVRLPHRGVVARVQQ